MNADNTKAQMRKGVLEYCILAIISSNEIYASDIIDKMKDAKLIVVEGTLYPLLTRLKNWPAQLPMDRIGIGAARKYYTLTDEGKTFLDELHVTWDELVHTVNITTGKNSK